MVYRRTHLRRWCELHGLGKRHGCCNMDAGGDIPCRLRQEQPRRNRLRDSVSLRDGWQLDDSSIPGRMVSSKARLRLLVRNCRRNGSGTWCWRELHTYCKRKALRNLDSELGRGSRERLVLDGLCRLDPSLVLPILLPPARLDEPSPADSVLGSDHT